MATTTDIGRAAEDRACRYLQQQGLELLQRNYHCRQGEIDLVMRDARTTVFVEVRYRKSRSFGSGAESVDSRKQNKLLASAMHYLQNHKQAANQPCRFDVISLTADALHGNNTDAIEWISNAIEPVLIPTGFNTYRVVIRDNTSGNQPMRNLARNLLAHVPIKRSTAVPLLLVSLMIPMLTGCVGFVAGAATGAAIAHDERSPSTILEDETIEVKAKEALYHDPKLDRKIHINVTSFNHVVLLTGEVLSRSLRDYAVGIVSRVDKVKVVHNEIAVADLASFSSRSHDTWITTKIKTDMLGAKGFDSGRVKVVTERGSVYLLGIVTPEQGNQAAEIARNVDGVKQVIKMFEYVTPVTPAA